MRYFRLSNESKSVIEYITVVDDITEIKTVTNDILVEEISKQTYEEETNMNALDWDDEPLLSEID
jgi:hypothetical protein